MIKDSDATTGTADDECLCVIKLFAGVGQEVKTEIMGVRVSGLACVARVIDQAEYFDVGKSVKRFTPQILNGSRNFTEAVYSVKQRAMIFKDVANPDAVNIESHSTEAGPLRAGRLVIRLNGEV